MRISSGAGSRHTVVARTGAVTEAFLAALELPDLALAPGSRAACAAVHEAPTYLLLLEERGAAVRPHLPQEPCGRPRAEVLAAPAGIAPTEEVVHSFPDGS